MKYRDVADLDEQIVRWLGRLPRDLDLIVGIPRSGVLPATLLALHLNVPFTDVEGFVEGRVLEAGPRYTRGDVAVLLDEPRNVLVVDDSILLGRQMQKVKERIRAAGLPHNIRYAAVYPAPGSEDHVDFFAEVVDTPRCFEWNVMHHPWILSKTCMDIDGVLCRDPLDDENDDGVEYLRFLREAEPRYLPSARVRWLVTARLEKYRSPTEEWLAANGVEYDELIMMDYPDMAARRAAGAYASFKADIYRTTRALLFIESSPALAAEIARLSGRSVFCMETRKMIEPMLVPRLRRDVWDRSTNVRRRVADAVDRLALPLRRSEGLLSRSTTRRPRPRPPG
jgi:orotate phosphoribosyltransferase